MAKETYNIGIEVRNSNGKLIRDREGNKYTALQVELSFDTEAEYSHGIKGALESHMRQIGNTMKAWALEGAIITVEASWLNTISSTYMVMHSYYVNENRFIHH